MRIRVCSLAAHRLRQELLLLLDHYKSVNRLTTALNSTTPAKFRIYPNRVHTLLKEDPERSVNPSSFQAIKRAVERLLPEAVETADERLARTMDASLSAREQVGPPPGN